MRSRVEGTPSVTALRATLAAGAVLFAGTMPSPVAARVSAPRNCPRVMPLSSVSERTGATGYTVSRGSAPEPFGVDVLGVLSDGIAPGRHMIIVETSGPAVERAGGIWAGMSGSPVYADDGRIIGAVAFGLSSGPSAIGGLTPAGDMVDLLGYGGSSAAPMTTGAAGARDGRVALSPELRARIAEATDAPRTAVGKSMVRLKTPLSVSGIGRGRRLLRTVIAREGLAAVPHAGSSVSRAAATEEGPRAGGNFAATLSYGDITLAGVGTTTMVCDGAAVAFGHPFFWDGETRMGANGASAITVVDDPLAGPYKLAAVKGGWGTVDQDRLAGIRAVLGRLARVSRLRSRVTNRDTGASRAGLTDVVVPDLIPLIAFMHSYSNIDSSFDEVGKGSSSLEWTVRGTTASGRRWAFARSNKFISNRDISFDSLFEMAEQLSAVARNRFTEVRFSSVDLSATVGNEIRKYTVARALVSRNGGRFRARARLRVRPGDRLRVRTVLRASDGSGVKKVQGRVRVPRRFRRDAVIAVAGGERDAVLSTVCLRHPNRRLCRAGERARSFRQLLRALERAPKNTEVVISLSRSRWSLRGLDRDTAATTKVVRGSELIRLINIGSGGGRD